MKLYLPKRVDEPKFYCGLSLLETIWDVLCNGDVLLHIQGQQINLTLKTCCDIFDKEMHIIVGQVVKYHRNHTRVSEIRVADLMSWNPISSRTESENKLCTRC